MELNQIVTNIKRSKQCSLKADSDSDESKTFNIVVSFHNVTLADVFDKCVSSEVIRWQNANRKNYDKLVDRSTINLTFKAPVSQVDPETAMVAKLIAMNDEDRANYLNQLMQKVTS